MKSRLPSSATVQARPDSSGVTVSSMSLPYRFMPASSRSVSRAPRPQGATPAAPSACQKSAADSDGQHDLEAVLAGVAGARDEPFVAGGAEERAERARGGAAGLRQERRRLRPRVRPLHGDHREIAPRHDRDADRLRVFLDPGEVLVGACPR